MRRGWFSETAARPCRPLIAGEFAAKSARIHAVSISGQTSPGWGFSGVRWLHSHFAGHAQTQPSLELGLNWPLPGLSGAAAESLGTGPWRGLEGALGLAVV